MIETAMYTHANGWHAQRALPAEVQSVRIQYGTTDVYVFLNPDNDRLGVSVFAKEGTPGMPVVSYNSIIDEDE